MEIGKTNLSKFENLSALKGKSLLTIETKFSQGNFQVTKQLAFHTSDHEITGFKSNWKQNSAHDCMALYCTIMTV